MTAEADGTGGRIAAWARAEETPGRQGRTGRVQCDSLAREGPGMGAGVRRQAHRGSGGGSMMDGALDGDTPWWLEGGGAAGALARQTDWSATPLGPVERWPASLRMAAALCLRNRFPMVLMWGPELVMLYNDGYRPMLGDRRHPGAMGSRVRDCWSEAWPKIGPWMEEVLSAGRTIWREDHHFQLTRNGYPEDCYFTFAYSPVHTEDGTVGGVLATVDETTERVVGERCLRTLHELAQGAASATSLPAVREWLTMTLGANPADVPFALLFSVADGTARLDARVGVAADSPLAAEHRIGAGAGGWPLAAALAGGGAVEVADVAARFGLCDADLAELPATRAVVHPVPGVEHDAPGGAVLVVGVNPRRPLDEAYRRFLHLLAHHVGALLGAARARVEERARAALAARTAALEASEARLRGLLDSTPALIWTTGEEGSGDYFSSAWLAFTGRTLEQELGVGWASGVHPADRPGCLRAFGEAVASRSPFRFEYRLRRADGVHRWMLSVGAPRVGPDGAFLGHIGTSLDITEQRELENALRRAELQYRELVEMAPAVVWRGVGDPLRITFVNGRASELSGIPVERWTSEPRLWLEQTHPDDRAAALAALVRALRAPQEMELRMRNARGDDICLRSFVRYIGETTAGPEFMGMMFDETELRLAREEVEASRTQLRELAERLQAIRDAEQARIAREIHDELGQALTGLKLQVAWLAGRLPDDSVELVESADDSLALIDGTIDTVRRIATRLRPGVLDDLGLFAALEWLTHDFERRTGVPCRLTLPESACPVAEEHATTLFRIAQEALTNVARHAGASRVALALRRAGAQCVLSVMDDGRGMPADLAAGPPSLGLLGMRERAIASGGSMTIESRPGEGTTVRAFVGGRRPGPQEARA